MKAAPRLWIAGLVALLASLACRGAELANGLVRISFDDSGFATQLVEIQSGRHLAYVRAPFVALEREDGVVEPVGFSLKDGTATWRFPDAGEVVLGIAPFAGGWTFEVRRAAVPKVRRLRVGGLAGVACADYASATAQAVSDRSSGIVLRGYEEDSHGRFGNELHLKLEADRPLVGRRFGLAAGPRPALVAALQAMTRASGFPHTPAGGPWALEAELCRGSYLDAPVTAETADAFVALASLGGCDALQFRTNDAALVARIHAAGLRAGLHVGLPASADEASAERLGALLRTNGFDQLHFDGVRAPQTDRADAHLRARVFAAWARGGRPCLAEGACCETDAGAWWYLSRVGANGPAGDDPKRSHDRSLERLAAMPPRLGEFREMRMGPWCPSAGTAHRRAYAWDDAEYFAGKNAALDAAMSVSGVGPACGFEALGELAILGWYERFRRARAFQPWLLELLAQPMREACLRQDDDGIWRAARLAVSSHRVEDDATSRWLADVPVRPDESLIRITARGAAGGDGLGMDGVSLRINRSRYEVPFALAAGESAECADGFWTLFDRHRTPLRRVPSANRPMVNFGTNGFVFAARRVTGGPAACADVTVLARGRRKPALVEFAKLPPAARARLARETTPPVFYAPQDGFEDLPEVVTRPGEPAELTFTVRGPIGPFVLAVGEAAFRFSAVPEGETFSSPPGLFPRRTGAMSLRLTPIGDEPARAIFLFTKLY